MLRAAGQPAQPNHANTMSEQDITWMQQALAEARAAATAGEVPIGAVLVCDGQAVVRAHNRTIIDCDPTAHAEMIALRAGAQVLRNYRLTGATLYVTTEPCAMCAGAMIQARIARVVYGCKESKGGAAESCFAIFDHPMVNHRVEVLGGVLADDCARVLQEFFQARR
jgi:tRNA(adenine34) deaminase